MILSIPNPNLADFGLKPRARHVVPTAPYLHLVVDLDLISGVSGGGEGGVG
jgi:hypothetical protein